jgi:hypothetical protein
MKYTEIFEYYKNIKSGELYRIKGDILIAYYNVSKGDFVDVGFIMGHSFRYIIKPILETDLEEEIEILIKETMIKELGK